jgi:hypothetical protein
MGRAMNLRKYIEYRRAELTAERDRIAGQSQAGISMGGLMAHDNRAKIVDLLLTELDLILKWIEAGEPAFIPPLTAEEQRFWRNALDRGLAIPEEIRDLL